MKVHICFSYLGYHYRVEWIDNAIEAVTAIAVVFAVGQLVGDRTQRHREFENLYVQRYWALLDRMSDELYYGGNDVVAGGELDKRTKVAYLRLCEDEIDLRAQGFVTDKTWKIWGWGIESQIKQRPYLDQLKAMGQDELPSLRAYLEDPNKDPLKWRRPKRWWSGLC